LEKSVNGSFLKDLCGIVILHNSTALVITYGLF